MSKLVRVSDEAYSKLNSILKQANEAYAAMQQDKIERAEEQKELALWDVTLQDGLYDE